MTDLKSLIAELEQAKAGSRGLDAKIAVAAKIDLPTPMGDMMGVPAKPYLKLPISMDCEVGTYWLVQFSGMSLRTSPPFSTSLDAALTLVLEGFAIENFMIWPGHPASLTILGTHNDGDKCWHNSSDGRWKGEAATPPLAVSIAALKARDHA